MGWETLLFLGICLILLYMYLTRTHSYWSSRSIPGPRPLPLFGTYLSQFSTPLQDSEMERYQKYGPIYGIYEGIQPGLIVGRPDLVKEIMVGKTALEVFSNRRAVKTTHPVMSKFLTSLEDEPWKRVRSITAPAFSSGKLRCIIPFMTAASDFILSTLDEASSANSDVDLKSLFGSFTMDVIAKSAFATKPTPQLVNQVSQLFTFPFWRKFLDYVMPMWILESFNFTVLPPDPLEFFRDVTTRIIRHRRETGEQHHDFLQILMNAEAERGLPLGQRKLTEEEIVAQAIFFFSGGFESSSQLLTYVAYCLALHPEAQEEAYQEVRRVLGHEEGMDDIPAIHPDLLMHLQYMNAVIDETLRLYSPVLRVERRASRDFALGDTGILVPKGMIVGIPVWALHHSEEYFPEPWNFVPERFLPENRGSIVPSTYLPFGDGPRSCIGSRFALLECQIALVKILGKFRLIPSPNTKNPLEFLPTGRPLLGPKSVLIRAERRC